MLIDLIVKMYRDEIEIIPKREGQKNIVYPIS
jgi:hypothetical protein